MLDDSIYIYNPRFLQSFIERESKQGICKRFFRLFILILELDMSKILSVFDEGPSAKLLQGVALLLITLEINEDVDSIIVFFDVYINEIFS